MIPERDTLVAVAVAAVVGIVLGWLVSRNTILFAAVMGRSTTTAAPATEAHARTVDVLGRVVWNFDFNTPWPSQYADQPITMVFTGKATMRNVRAILKSIHVGNSLGRKGDPEYRAATMYESVAGLPPFSSSGLKTDPEFRPMYDSGGIPYDYHIRIYGPFTTPKYGTVVIGATHRDYSDANNNLLDANEYYGFNETAEAWFTRKLKRRGCIVHPNALNFNNKLNLVDTAHSNYFQSDGRATVVEVWGSTCRARRP